MCETWGKEEKGVLGCSNGKAWIAFGQGRGFWVSWVGYESRKDMDLILGVCSCVNCSPGELSQKAYWRWISVVAD